MRISIFLEGWTRIAIEGACSGEHGMGKIWADTFLKGLKNQKKYILYNIIFTYVYMLSKTFNLRC